MTVMSNVMDSHVDVRVGKEECKEGSRDYKMGTRGIRKSFVIAIEWKPMTSRKPWVSGFLRTCRHLLAS